MGTTPSSELSVVLCNGKRKHTRLNYNSRLYKTISIDIDPTTRPDIVGDVRTVYKTIPDDSLNQLIFHFCPTYLLAHSSLSQWFRKVKVGGKVVIHGPPVDVPINISHSLTKKWDSLQRLLQKQVIKSKLEFKWKVIPGNPNLILGTRIVSDAGPENGAPRTVRANHE